MNVYLMRHGEPEEEEPRSLTVRGEAETRIVAQWMKSIGARPRAIRHSGALRAQQTAQLVSEVLGDFDGVSLREGLHPNDDPDPVARALQNETDDLMLVGHLPFMARLTGALVGASASAIVVFEPATAVCLSREGGAWSILWVMSPRLLI